MRRAPLIALLGIVVAPAPAAADTVAHRTPAIGPKIAGAQTVWGEERNEGVKVMIGSGGEAPRALYRLPDSGARKTERTIFHTPWSLSASPTHVAAIVHTGTITTQDFDFVVTTSAASAVGGPLGGVQLLAGRTPRRGDDPCEGTLASPRAVAVDGGRIATAEHVVECETRESHQARVAVRDGAAVQHVPIEHEVHTLQLAGRYLARVREAGRRHELIVTDLATNAELLREGHFAVGDIDLDADGTVALTYADGSGDRRLGLMRVGTPGLRSLDRRVADRGVALAGGRVLYEKLDRGDFRSRLLLRDLDGGVRRLATFTPRRRRAGDLDLSADRAVWAAQKTRSGEYEAKPSGPARIVSRPL